MGMSCSEQDTGATLGPNLIVVQEEWPLMFEWCDTVAIVKKPEWAAAMKIE